MQKSYEFELATHMVMRHLLARVTLKRRQGKVPASYSAARKTPSPQKLGRLLSKG